MISAWMYPLCWLSLWLVSVIRERRQWSERRIKLNENERLWFCEVLGDNIGRQFPTARSGKKNWKLIVNRKWQCNSLSISLAIVNFFTHFLVQLGVCQLLLSRFSTGRLAKLQKHLKKLATFRTKAFQSETAKLDK